MKVLKTRPELCIACHNCENACANAWFKQENLEKSCIRIKKEKAEVKITTCTQCGECINVCPVQAIYRDKRGIVRVNKKMCVGCFMCVGFCPEGAMMVYEDMIEPFKCTSCGQCVKVCQMNALYISEED